MIFGQRKIYHLLIALVVTLLMYFLSSQIWLKKFTEETQHINKVFKYTDLKTHSHISVFTTQSNSLTQSVKTTPLTVVSYTLASSSVAVEKVESKTSAIISVESLPISFNFPSHLQDDPKFYQPMYMHSKGRTNVSIILGIPTVQRYKQSYLIFTLRNLLKKMNAKERNDTLIAILIAEINPVVVQEISTDIITTFKAHTDSGLIDIIAPSTAYYPNFNQISTSLNDSLERTKWRSKQNLDYAYLMAYAHSRGLYYVQLEDDIVTKKNFITTMKTFADNIIEQDLRAAWFMLDFCEMGFIGKMFKCKDLPQLSAYFQLFYMDKPVDWLLINFFETKYCGNDLGNDICKLEISKYWHQTNIRLFQHVGLISSLNGKIQKIKDQHFKYDARETNVYTKNPTATVLTNMRVYKNFSIERAYQDQTYFVGLTPKLGDFVQFIFHPAIRIYRYSFSSGSYQYPSDRFYNTTVEILVSTTISNNSSLRRKYHCTADDFFVVGSFNRFGIAEGIIDAEFGALKQMRLMVHSNSVNWVRLTDILLEPVRNATLTT